MHVQRKSFLYFVLMIAVVLNQTSSGDVIPFATEPPNGCAQRCGDIEIKYPFGLGTNCTCNEYFQVTCDTTSSLHKPKPILTKINLELLEVHSTFYDNDSSLFFGHITVKTPAVKACANSTRWSSVDLKGSPFFYDAHKNLFGTVGCEGNASLYGKNGEILSIIDKSSCSNSSYKNKCNCQKDIKNFGDYKLKGYSVEVSVNKGGNCQTAFMMSNKSAAFMTLVGSDLPLALGWSSNDYVHCEQFPYISQLEHRDMGIIAIRVIGITIYIVLLFGLVSCCCCCLCSMCERRKRRKEVRRRAKYFNNRLAEISSSDREVIEKTKLFTIKELEIATNKFSENRILGQGGQGTVYKGMLRRGQIVAVKRSKNFEESQWQEFINEVIILSQVNHRNIVKILGFCLETKVPLLVYEFIPNGTLSEHIHNNSTNEFLLSWEMRVRIACEAASAIAYLHSSSTTPIYHRDIKSSNILLDEKFQAKVSDFGISKAISLNQTHLTTRVQGTFGYLDPEYFQSGQFSEKSDVFSFGVILVEILTAQKPIRMIASEENKSLVDYFLSSMIEFGLKEILDPIVSTDSKMEEVVLVANLAKRCLNSSGAQRPTMVQVAMELERLRKMSCSTPLTIGQVSREFQSVAARSKLKMVDAFTSQTMCDVATVHGDDDEEKCLFFKPK